MKNIFKFFLSASILVVVFCFFSVDSVFAYTYTINLQEGISDAQVVSLQQVLNMNGFTVAVTGAGSRDNESTYFGHQTKAAVMAFQKSKNLTIDGVVGVETGTNLASLSDKNNTGAVLGATTSTDQIQQQSSFENAMPTNYTGSCNASYSPWSCIEGSMSWSHSISSLYKRMGNNSWKTELRPGDVAVAFGSYRTEMTMIPKGSAISTSANTYRISMYIPSSASAWVNLAQERIVGLQLHPWVGTTTNGYPDFSLQIKSGNFQRAIVHTGTNTSISAPQTSLYKTLAPVPYDTWIDWEIYVDPKATVDGRVIIDMTVDGVKKRVDDYTGYTLQAWSSWPFAKMGVYDWNINSSGGTAPRVVYFDMAAYGKATPSTFSSLMDISPTPTPTPTPTSTPTPVPITNNTPPVVSAGINQTVSSSTTSVALDGEATDVNEVDCCSIHIWSQVSGPNTAKFIPTNWNPVMSGLVSGTYIFRLAVTDNQGATTTDDVTVTVQSATSTTLYTHTITLKQGMTNSQVRNLQQALNKLGFLVATTGAGSPGMESTYFGYKTYKAVISFQIAKGFTANGIVGTQTGVAIQSLLNK